MSGQVTMTDTFVVRQLEDSKFQKKSEILAEGFPKYSLAFWHNRRQAMAQRERAPGTPAFGYGFDVGGLQGVILTFGSSQRPPSSAPDDRQPFELDSSTDPARRGRV